MNVLVMWDGDVDIAGSAFKPQVFFCVLSVLHHRQLPYDNHGVPNLLDALGPLREL